MNTKFYKELELLLPTSSAEQRRQWSATIIENNIDVKELAQLLKGDPKIATRFFWLLSELGTIHPNRLLVELPFLLEFCEQLNPVYKTSFASFWHIAGVPEANEGQAIDLLFQWLISADTNVTIKSRSIWVLVKLTKKYPELKDELVLCLNDQLDKYTKDFKKRVGKILREIER
ncbi:MAG: hypothetical protein IT270_17100 [Saprospiraceae bacterium]|nr:hypothetical protein [Saprospiraceae bacterium]